jgi:hypothetical protein
VVHAVHWAGFRLAIGTHVMRRRYQNSLGAGSQPERVAATSSVSGGGFTLSPRGASHGVDAGSPSMCRKVMHERRFLRRPDPRRSCPHAASTCPDRSRRRPRPGAAPGPRGRRRAVGSREALVRGAIIRSRASIEHLNQVLRLLFVQRPPSATQKYTCTPSCTVLLFRDVRVMRPKLGFVGSATGSPN